MDEPAPGSIAVVAGSGYFADYRAACVEWLTRLGWSVAIHDELSDTDGYDGVLVVGIHLHPHPPYRGRQFRVSVQTEQLALSGESDRRLRRNRRRFGAVRHFYDLVIEWSPAQLEKYPPGIDARHIPHGCRPTSPPSDPPEFDVMFVGNPTGSNNRRAELLAFLRERYRMYPDHFGWGEEKDRAIRSSSICLNIHYYETRSFEAPRMFELLAGGAFVVSEVIYDSFPFRAGYDYVAFSTRAELIDLMDRYLADPQARREISESGRRTAADYSFERVIGRLSDELLRVSAQVEKRPAACLSWLVGHAKSYSIEIEDELARRRRMLMSRRARLTG